jgi:hypothetical protein
MQITFAGTLIAKEFPEGGFDAVQGFSKPRGSAAVQWVKPIRARSSRPKNRNNAEQYINGTVTRSPSPTLADAMTARGIMFQSLLDLVGPLVFTIGTVELSYRYAALKEYDTVENADGVAVGFKLTFAVGEAEETNLALATEGGISLETESGQIIGS